MRRRFDGEPFRPYNVVPDALLVNFKSLRFVFLPEDDARCACSSSRRCPALEVVNALQARRGRLPRRARVPRSASQADFQSAAAARHVHRAVPG